MPKTVVLACSALEVPLSVAQSRMGTHHPVVLADRKYHDSPKQMRLHLMELLDSLEPDVDTVLVAMGFCGGSWDTVDTPRRLVIPRVDDCITLQLHTDHTRHANLKKTGHFYLNGFDRGSFSLEEMKDNLCAQYGEEDGLDLFEYWFESYHQVDIIETGIYDSRSPAFLEKARRSADLIRCALDFVPGSNLLLETLVSGPWDEQFFVAEPHRVFTAMDFA